MDYVLYIWLYTNSGHNPFKISINVNNKKECELITEKMKKEKFFILDNGKKIKFYDFHTECLN
jgi:hypothetical protein